MSHAIRPYTDDEKLRELSFQYLTDGHQFLQQAGVLLDDHELTRHCQYHIGYLSKISVTLYLSIECSLKSMICSAHIGEAPRSVYWKRIRPAGHSFAKLVKEIPDFATQVSDTSLEAELNRLMSAEISERYCFEVSSESDFLGEMKIDDARLVEKIDEAKQLHGTARTLRQKVWDVRKVAFDGHRTLPPRLVKEVLQRIKSK
jgi:hypothetical protein